MLFQSHSRLVCMEQCSCYFNHIPDWSARSVWSSVHVILITFETGLHGLYGVSVHVILITFQTGLPGLYGVSIHVILITFQTGLHGLYGVSIHVI